MRTCTCGSRNHPEFCISYDADSALHEDVEWLVGFLEKSVSLGSEYRPGQTCQIGWMVTSIGQRSDNDLALLEPDFNSLPVSWKESVTTTLRHLRLQKDVCESLGVVEEMEFPSICDSGIVGVDVSASNCEKLVLDRDTRSGNDSGWFVGSAAPEIDYNDASNLRRCSLYEVGMLAPMAVMFLALPEGFRVEIAERAVLFHRNGKKIEPLPRSLLADWTNHGG